jgi:hypothetical protein
VHIPSEESGGCGVTAATRNWTQADTKLDAGGHES